MVILSLLLHETSTIARGKAKGNSRCLGEQSTCYLLNIQSIAALLTA